jgi:hypothetical protein
MSQALHLNVSDDLYAALENHAKAIGTSPASVALESLEHVFTPGQLGRAATSPEEREEARLRFERHFGEIATSHPLGADNEAIDADLAREYADDHAEE